jgi:hypothetical protein
MTPRRPLAELDALKKQASNTKIKAKSKIKKAEEVNNDVAKPVHPSTILAVPNFMNPPPNEVDSYPLVMDVSTILVFDR